MSLVQFISDAVQALGVSAIPDGGYRLDFANSSSRLATSAEILLATKAQRIEADRQECRRRLFEHYGDAAEQLSRAMGIGYSAQATTNHAIGVAATIEASNVARDLINAATTIEEVEAVAVNWPVLT